MSNLQILITDDNKQAFSITPEKLDSVGALGGTNTKFSWVLRILDTDGKLHDLQFNNYERMNRYIMVLSFILKGKQHDSTSAA